MYQSIHLDGDSVHVWDDLKGYFILPKKDYEYAYRTNPNGDKMSFTGVRCSKTKRFGRHEDGCFETDVPLETRVLTDIYLNDDEPSTGHRKVFFDIEVSTVGGFSTTEAADKEVTAIALYDDIVDEYHVMVLDVNGGRDNITKGNVHVRFYMDEFDLLSSFLDTWEGISPTIISGWNSDGFDIPYLYRRIQNVMGMSHANRLSCIGKVKWSPYRKRYLIAGMSSLDYMLLYKKFTYTQMPNYRLDTIGKHEIGMGKVEYEGSLDNLFETDLDKFIEYSLTDVKILVGLDEKLKLIELVRGICHVGHVPYEDYAYSSRFLEGTLITHIHRKGLVVTDKDPYGRSKMDDGGDQFDGAYVKVPCPNRYEWVYSMDLQSLYPSIIMSLNISPETKAGIITNWNVHKYQNDELNKLNIELDGDQFILTLEQFKDYVTENNLCISSNGVLYRTDKIGIIPEILDTWFSDRLKYKTLMKEAYAKDDVESAEYYDRRQHIQKIFLNSLYGVLGLPIFRFYDLDNALAVTATGQDVIKQSEMFVNGLYSELGAIPQPDSYVSKYRIALQKEAKKKKERAVEPSNDDWCLYIDTDSLYFSSEALFKDDLNVSKQEFTIKLAKFMEVKVNEFYDDIARRFFNCNNHRLVIKGETVASAAIWTAKKRYGMLKTFDLEKNTIIDPPKLEVKGLDIVRSTFPIVFKTYMSDFLIKLLEGATKKQIESEMMKFYNHIKEEDYRGVARNTAINNISKYEVPGANFNEYEKGAPMHVKAAINYNKLIEEFGLEGDAPEIVDGEKVKFVLLSDNNPFRFAALAFKDSEDPQQILDYLDEYADNVKMFESELRNKLEAFFNSMGWGKLPIDIKIDNDVLSMFGL